jgi:MFS transporter, DHA2 family, multidrug resistance protein
LRVPWFVAGRENASLSALPQAPGLRRPPAGGKIAAMEFPDGLPPAQRMRALITLGIAISVSVLNSAVVNIALPSIATDLAVSPATSVWVVNAYQMAVIAALLPCASLGDILGYRRVYAWGLVVFTVATLASALSPTLPVLALARAVQGLGGAGIMSVNTALIRFIFPRAQLGRGMGINAMIVAASSALGPSVAAGVLSVAHWPWLFWTNVPLGVLALVLLGALPLSPLSRHRFDTVSAVLNAATFILLISALDGIGEDGFATVAAQFAGAAAVGYVFVRRQLVVPAPMLPVDLFRRPVFALTVATSICSFLAQTAAYVALPFLFEVSMGHGQVATGLMMTPWPLLVGVVAPFAGWLADRYPAGILGGIGLSVMTVGLLLLLFLQDDPSGWQSAWRMAVCGAGFALFQSPNNRQMISSVPRERTGAGSGMLSTARLLGQTSGAAMVAVLFNLTEAAGVGQGARAALVLAVGCSLTGAVCSSLRMVRR